MTITTEDLQAILAAEKQNALGALQSSELADQREKALQYYLGECPDLVAPDNRSQAVSTDVADVIEGMMPAMVEIFMSGDEIVRIEPVGPEDEAAAIQETAVLNHVMMQQNDGFRTLHDYIKDSLLSKLSVVKCWYETGTQHEFESYRGQPPEIIAGFAADPDLEIIEEKTDAETGLVDITVRQKSTSGRIKLANVAPENFGFSRSVVNFRDATYVYETVTRTVAELLDAGYDHDLVMDLSSPEPDGSMLALARDDIGMLDGSVVSDEANKLMQQVEVTEHYIRLDWDDDGYPEWRKITTAGAGGEVLENVRWDGRPPYSVMSPILMPHRAIGRSVADLAIEIQRIKTFLLRQLLDNTAFQNATRLEVSQSAVGPKTIEDLLSNRPGGIVRTAAPGGIAPIPTPSVAQFTLPLLEYVDTIRETRTGVTRYNQGLDADSLNKTASGVQQIMGQSEQRFRLVARVMGETGIKDLFSLLHETLRRNSTQSISLKLSGRWVKVDPRQWRSRTDLTIAVGIGSGSRDKQMGLLQQLLTFQVQALTQMGGLGGMITQQHIFNTLNRMVQFSGLKTTELYATDPASIPAQPPAPPEPNPVELTAQIENGKLQLAGQKAQLEAQAAQQKFALDQQRLALDAERLRLEMALRQAEVDLKARAATFGEQEASAQIQLDQQKVEIEAHKAAVQVEQRSRETLDTVAPLVTQTFQAVSDQQTDGLRLLTDQLATLAARMSAPKSVIRDEAGRPVGVQAEPSDPTEPSATLEEALAKLNAAVTAIGAPKLIHRDASGRAAGISP
ncbi:hypothetical protein GGE65_007719 [Skermanella aerolata]|uniref:portal protein n=1 Tax=Skermanella aerolata TaxID=393310 RepID=UPI003D1D15E3